MESTSLLHIAIVSKDGRVLGTVSNPIRASFTDRWLALPTGEITVAADDPCVPHLLTPGARVSVTYERNPVTPAYWGILGGRLMWPHFDGRVGDRTGSLMSDGEITFQVTGEWRILRNTRAWVIPGSPLEASSLSDPGQSWSPDPIPVGQDGGRWGYFQWGPLTYAAEFVKQLIDLNINNRWEQRFGAGLLRPLEFLNWGSPDIPLGNDVTGSLPDVRFGTVEDAVIRLLTAGKLGMRIESVPVQSGSSSSSRYNRTVKFFEPRVWPVTLTPDAGTVVDGSWAQTAPNATDVIVGGPGELSARAFTGQSDVDLSLLWGERIEVFREATNAPVEWPAAVAEALRVVKYYLLRPEVPTPQKEAFARALATAGLDALADGQVTSGVTAQIAESEGFRFTGAIDPGSGVPRGFAVGDVVTIAPSAAAAYSGLTFTDRITEVTVSVSRDRGVTVTPQVGQRNDDPDVRLALAVRALAEANSRRASSQ